LKPPVKLVSSFLSLLCCLTVAASAKEPELPSAPAPAEVLHEGLLDPAFLAIDADNVVFVSEVQAGRVLQILPDGRVQSVVEGLKKPQGLAVDDDGTLYIAAEEWKETKLKGLVLKWEEGSLQVLASELKKPTGLTIDETGTLYVVTEGEDETRGRIFRIDPSSLPTLIAAGFKHPRGLAFTPDGQLLVAAERLQGEGEGDGGTIYQVDPNNGTFTRLVGSGFQHPHSVVPDHLGSVFFSARARGRADDRGRISQRVTDETLTTFAAPLTHPKGLAFDRHGNLYAIEAKGGRLLRFRAPPPPQVDPLAAFRNTNPLTVTGTAEPDALITVTGGASPASVITSGPFAIPVSLTPNQLTALNLFVTGAKGFGLAGVPIEMTTTHDNVPPLVRTVSPTEGATLTGAFTVDVEATDALAGIAVVELLIDGNVVGVTNVAPYRFSLEAGSFTGGPHTVTARATDRAGNRASASVAVVIASLRVTITTDLTGPSLEGQIFTYPKPGLYFPTATITDLQGNQVTTTALIQVYDRAALDAALQAKWSGMKDVLRGGDIGKALNSVALSDREGYLPLLTALGPQLSNIDRILTDISPVSFDGDRAEYQMIRIDNGVRISHFVLFAKDLDGIWRLKFF
jgi:sugar lactone lactonase YvrE